jgi:DUF4097 and DUF4098 domain-containing protein YvlB
MTISTFFGSRSTGSIRYLAGFVILLSAVLTAGCISITTDGDSEHGTAEENQLHTFDVGENPFIDVTGYNGPIEIVTGDDGVVDVEAELRIPSRISYAATLSGNTVTVIAKKTGSGISFGRSPQADIRLTIPKQATIKAHTSNGRVTITGVTGDGDLSSSNGKITISNSTGAYTSSTSNGAVILDGVIGQFSAETSNGRIEFSGTFDGDSDNSFKTSNGSIHIVFDGEPSVEIDARTSNGSVESDRPILATTTEKTRLVGTYGDGSASLELRTSNGSIDLR